jgi:hypothetical protein
MKVRSLRIAMLIFGMALFTSSLFQNCAPVSFKPEEAASTLTAKGDEQAVPAVCDDGQISGSIKWEVVNGQNIEEPGKCDFGGNLTLVYEKQQKLLCDAGKYVGSSEFQKGKLLGQKGACNCADGVNNGMSVWKNVDGQNIVENQACPANGTLTLTYEKQQKYTCDNGKLISSDNYQKGKLISQSGACKCADGSAEGSASIKLVPNATITEQGLCPNGGNLQYIYEKQQKYVCTNSQSVAQNEFSKGKLLQTTGACSCEGGIASGGSKFVTLAGQTISEAASCKYGGNLANLFEKQEKNLCSNGAFSGTGEYQKGAFLRQDGACNPPPVLSESFTIAATKTTKPLDMVWVIDNSGSMTDKTTIVRSNLTAFINALDKASDMKFLLLSKKGTTGLAMSLPSGLDPNRFIQADKAIGSWDGPAQLISQLNFYISSGTPFFRQDSKKIIVFVTDDNSKPMTAADFTAGLAKAGVASGQAGIFGFIGLGKALSPCQAATGVEYQTLVSQTGGKAYNICEKDWTQYFSDLKADVLTKLGRSFTMKDTMVAKIVKVEVDGVAIDASKYSFANGVLMLADDVTMTEQSSVKVSYTQQ